MINREYFTDIGRDIKNGVYKNLLRGTSEYITLWDTIIDRCYNGYTVGGVYITPELWSYVNFGSILLADDEGQGKNVGLPKLRDVDWEIDYYFHEADRLKKGLNLVGGRRLGKTNLITWHASANTNSTSNKRSVSFNSANSTISNMSYSFNYFFCLVFQPFYVCV